MANMGFTEIVFSVLNGWNMAGGSLLIAGILLYRSFQSTFKVLNLRIKAFNWLLLAVAFILTEAIDVPSIVERTWLRTTFALLLIGEIAYHGDCIVDLFEEGIRRMKPNGINRQH